ncbi:MAG: hypothetical protein ABL958_05930 [Bdellovibrionia bacterium]
MLVGAVNLGCEFLVDRARSGPPGYATVTAREHPAFLFALGWKILYDEVIMGSAQALLSLIARHESAKHSELQFLRRTVEKAVKDGTPWVVQSRLDPLEFAVGAKTTKALAGLIGRFPQLPGQDGPIHTMDQVQAVFLFISEF